MNGLVCLVVSLATAHARAQEVTAPPGHEAQSEETVEAASDESDASQSDRAANAVVELSMFVSPQLVIGSIGALGSLGGLSNGMLSFPVGLDVAFALVPSIMLSVGVSGGFVDAPGYSSLSLTVPLSLLFYLEEPRVGRVSPTLRVGGAVGYSDWRANDERSESVSGQLVARGGITWLALSCLALRAELGLAASATSYSGDGATFGSLGLDASIAVVLRI